MIGVYHHASPNHLDHYVDEFAFRLNEGNVANHTMTRLDSFVKGSADKRLTIQGADPMSKPPENVPKALDAIADIVLAYKPKPKSKPGKKRKKRAAKIAKENKIAEKSDTFQS